MPSFINPQASALLAGDPMKSYEIQRFADSILEDCVRKLLDEGDAMRLACWHIRVSEVMTAPAMGCDHDASEITLSAPMFRRFADAPGMVDAILTEIVRATVGVDGTPADVVRVAESIGAPASALRMEVA